MSINYIFTQGFDMVDKFKTWWNGKKYHIEGVFPGSHYKRHWTANLVRSVVGFYLKNWQWCLAFFITIITLLIKII